MIICFEYKIVFIAVPKTATRSIYGFLKKHYNGKLHADHCPKVPDEYKDYFSFIVSRNPYDRACSAYWHVCKKLLQKNLIDTRWYDRYGYQKLFDLKGWENTFENYLKIIRVKPRLHSQPQYLFYKQNRIDQILRFENLQEDFNTLPFLNKPAQLGHANSTTISNKGYTDLRPHWKEMINKTTGKMINELYKEDFEHLGYDMLDFK